MKPLLAMTMAVLISAPLAPALSSPTAPAPAERRPNVVLVLTDDMRRDDLRYMDFTRRFFRRHGTEFRQAISSHPLCCPARAQLVTGQYAQNNGVSANRGDWGGYAALDGRDDLIFRWFRAAGYRTSYVGKFLHGYENAYDKDIPGLVDNDMSIRNVYNAHGVVTYNNGRPETRKRHQTRFTTNSVVRSIKRAGTRPFFAWAGHVAPHAMPGTVKYAPNPPKEYRSFDAGDRWPPSLSKPSFNALRPGSEKREIGSEWITEVHRQRVLSLYAVDDGVRRIVKVLRRQGVYRDTILVFASDNGMGLGSHRLMGKNQPYQDIVRVPLLMAGPGVPAGERISTVATLVDLPVTLARLTSVAPMRTQDGRDLFSLPDDRAVLVQAGAAGSQFIWRGVYTRRYTYVRRHDGLVEFYDREDDPHELSSRPHDPRVAQFETLLATLGACSDQTCQQTHADW